MKLVQSQLFTLPGFVPQPQPTSIVEIRTTPLKLNSMKLHH